MSGIVERVEAAIEAIHQTDASIRAWVTVDDEGALRQARLATSRLEAGEDLPLAGVTVGIKDIFDVAGLPTIAGFLPFAERVAERDAEVVRRLRAAGAVIVGKTATTQFAAGDPAMTRNPWNLERTPGGSSAGSAAAVAARQVDVALGTQTAGSVLRPSSFCGIVGFKPAYGWASKDRLIPYAVSLDTVGIHAHSVRDAARVYDVLARDGLPRCGSCRAVGPPRIGVWTDALAHAAEEMRDAIIDVIARLAESGATVQDTICPVSFRNLHAIHQVIMWVEGAAAHRELFAHHAGDYGPRLRSTIEVGQAIPAHDYARALKLRDEVREQVIDAWSAFDVIAIPTSATVAPTPETTGNPQLQAIPTLLGLPSISLPSGLDPDGMPVGLQLVAPHPDAAVHLLRVARWVESQLPRLPAPPHAADAG